MVTTNRWRYVLTGVFGALLATGVACGKDCSTDDTGPEGVVEGTANSEDCSAAGYADCEDFLDGSGGGYSPSSAGCSDLESAYEDGWCTCIADYGSSDSAC
jgi:hypothetical protein